MLDQKVVLEFLERGGLKKGLKEKMVVTFFSGLYLFSISDLSTPLLLG